MQPNKAEGPVKSPQGFSPREPDFTRELAAYERHRERLERHHMYQVALLHGDDLVGVFGDVTEACEEGFRRFGLDQYMFKEIGDPVHFFPYGVLPSSPDGD